MKRILSLLLCLSLLICILPEMAVWTRAASTEENEGSVSVSYAGAMSGGAETNTVSVEMAPVALQAAPAVDAKTAGEAMREVLLAHGSSFEITVVVDYALTQQSAGALFNEVYNYAVAHTGVPNEGDYINFNGCSWQGGGSFWPEGGRYYCNMRYAIGYYTTAQQELEMDAAVDALLEKLDLWDATEYEKVRGIYDYICSNITYDYDNLYNNSYTLKFTAYAALINKTAVCQGYATLFYRLALALGLDARVVAGTSEGVGHAWNIVKIGSLYYDLDSTWDAGVFPYEFFLRSEANFTDHIREAVYETAAFHTAYPMSDRDHPGALGLGEDAIAGGSFGSGAKWRIDTGYVLHLEGNGSTDNYSILGGMPWYDHRSRIVAVEIGEGVTGLGNYVLMGCTAIDSIVIPESVKSIGRGVFRGCTALSQVEFAGEAPTFDQLAFNGLNAEVIYHNNGSWNADKLLQYGGTIQWTSNSTGDFTGDDKVDNNDVIYLLWHTLFGNEYPVGNGDVNGDGNVSNEDVIYLLWHTLFGAEEYPLK